MSGSFSFRRGVFRLMGVGAFGGARSGLRCRTGAGDGAFGGAGLDCAGAGAAVAGVLCALDATADAMPAAPKLSLGVSSLCARAAIDETRPAAPNDNFGEDVWCARDAAADAIAAAPNDSLGEGV